MFYRNVFYEILKKDKTPAIGRGFLFITICFYLVHQCNGYFELVIDGFVSQVIEEAS